MSTSHPLSSTSEIAVSLHPAADTIINHDAAEDSVGNSFNNNNGAGNDNDEEDSPNESQDAGGRPNANDACIPIVQTLMFHRKGGESEGFSKRAIESLVKKLKEKRDELESLIEAVTSNGARVGRCVTIARTLDGRLQVAGKKGFPHVIYARIWRYTDLHKNELQAIKECRYAFDNKQDLVCVNPFHYTRVVAPSCLGDFGYGLGMGGGGTIGGPNDPFLIHNLHHHESAGAASSVLAYGAPLSAGGPHSFRMRDPTAAAYPNGLAPNGVKIEDMKPSSQAHFISSTSQFSNNDMLPDSVLLNARPFSRPPNGTVLLTTGTPQLQRSPLMQPRSQNFSASLSNNKIIPSPASVGLDFSTFNIASQQSSWPPPYSAAAAAGEYSPPQQQRNMFAAGDAAHTLSPVLPRATPHHIPPPPPPLQSGGGPRHLVSMPNNNNPLTRNTSGDIPPTVYASYHSQALEQDRLQVTMPASAAAAAAGGGGGSNNNMVGSILLGHVDLTDEDRQFSQLLRSQPQPESWCSVTYYELDQKVGEMFKVPNIYTAVDVDGYVDPSGHTGGSRICLGALSNIHRQDQSERTRMYIGKGVKLERHEESDVWLRNLSEHSVFVQSYYLDSQAGREPGQAVHKIYPQACIKVFDLRQCFTQLMQHARMSRDSTLQQQQQLLTGNSSSQSTSAESVAPTDSNNNNTSADAGAVVKLLKSPPHLVGSNNNNVGVDDFVRFCVLRMSFVKGWGPDYPKRQEIRHTPCWIEVQIQRALQLLDDVLRLVPGVNNAARGQEYV